MINKIYIVSVLCFLSLWSLGQEAWGSMRITVTDSKTKEPCVNCQVRVLPSNDTTYTDSTGYCEVKELDRGGYSVEVVSPFEVFKYQGVEVNYDQITFLDIVMVVNCNFQTKEENTCPHCSKNDKVIPVAYGLLAFDSKKEARKFYRNNYSGGCNLTSCRPLWYCKRDKKTF